MRGLPKIGPIDPLVLYLLAGVCFFIANGVAAVTGFGSNIIGLPLLALVVSLDGGKQSLIALSALLYLSVFIRSRHRVDWRQFSIIVIFAAIGLPIGMMLYARLPRHLAIILLGLFIAGVGLQNLLFTPAHRKKPHPLSPLLLVGGGIIHGAFTVGGPLLVVYADKTMPHKSVFRATLSLMWLTLNILLMTGWTMSHAWSHDTPRLILVGLPFTFGGLIVGEWAHHRVNERIFRRAVNVMLVLIGVMLIFSKAG